MPLHAAVVVVMVDRTLRGVIPDVNAVPGHGVITFIITIIIIMITGHHRGQESVTDDPQLMEAPRHIPGVQFTNIHPSISLSHILDQENIHLKVDLLLKKQLILKRLVGVLVLMYLTCPPSSWMMDTLGSPVTRSVLAVRIFVPIFSLVSFFHMSVRFRWFWTTQVISASSPTT